MTSEAGADVAFECAGVQAGLDAAVAGVRVGGTVVLVALWGEERPRIDAFGIVSQEKRVVGTAICEAGDMEAVIEVIASGKLTKSIAPLSQLHLCIQSLENGIH